MNVRRRRHIREQFGQERRIQALMSRTCQVATRAELKELLEAITGIGVIFGAYQFLVLILPIFLLYITFLL